MVEDSRIRPVTATTTGIAFPADTISRPVILTLGRGLMNSLTNSPFSPSRNTTSALRRLFASHQSGRS